MGKLLDKIIKEINELEEYKKLYEYAEKDKKRMSNLLYRYMTKEYESTTHEERSNKYKRSYCEDCKYEGNCKIELPQDIMKPIPSDKNWIPSTVGCKEFKWD